MLDDVVGKRRSGRGEQWRKWAIYTWRLWLILSVGADLY
jgi:hypothetical protein